MTNDKIIGREYYQRVKLGKGIVKENDSSKFNITMQKLFYTNGEYPFGELDLMGEGWIKLYPLNEEDRKITMSKIINGVVEREMTKFDERDYEKTLIYENKNKEVMALMYLDSKNHYHEIDIIARKNQEENPKIIENTKSMLERKLNCKLKDRTTEKEVQTSNLINKIESN